MARGNRTIAQRISLQPISDDSSEAELEKSIATSLSKLSKEDLADLLEAVTKNWKRASPRGRDDAASDELDAALAMAAVQGHDKEFARMRALDAISIERGSVRNAEYFEEAHRCNLSGLNIASAVLCRAMLEGALQQVVDPQRKMNPRPSPGYSPFIAMIEEAKQLDGERKSAAKEIKDAGDAAIHPRRIADFRKSYMQRMPEIIDNLRKVLIDLYGEPT